MNKKGEHTVEDLQERYLTGQWLRDKEEYQSFTELLSNPGKALVAEANRIKGGMTLVSVMNGRFDLIDPLWLVAYRRVLETNFSRDYMLEILTKVMEVQNRKVVITKQEMRIMQFVWNSYKQGQRTDNVLDLLLY